MSTLLAASSIVSLNSQIEITKRVIGGVYPGVTTVELDSLAAETAASLTTKHPDYATLAARIAVSNLHKQTTKTFSGVFLSPSLVSHRRCDVETA